MQRFTLLVLAAVAVLYLSFLTLRTGWQTYQVEQEIGHTQQEIRLLQKQLRVIEERQLYAQSEEFIEKVAREQLNLIKPGETAIVVNAPALPVSSADVFAPLPEPLWWQRWWDRWRALAARR